MGDLDENEDIGVDRGEDLLDRCDASVVLMIEPSNVPGHDIQESIGASEAVRHQLFCFEHPADAVRNIATVEELELRRLLRASRSFLCTFSLRRHCIASLETASRIGCANFWIIQLLRVIGQLNGEGGLKAGWNTPLTDART